MLNIVLAGTGGQGTVLAARLIGETAAAKGWQVRGSETIGMAQRGGSVVSHLRVAEKPGETAWSPLVSPGQAGLIIGFELAEAARALPLLSPEGTVIVADKTVQPANAEQRYNMEEILAYLGKTARRVIVADSAKIEEFAGARGLNVALLGVAIEQGALPFTLEEMEASLKSRIKSAYLEQNIKTLHAGGSFIKSA
jgi:indolepyruvate ferredoxin oxidoreductase beta subunit